MEYMSITHENVIILCFFAPQMYPRIFCSQRCKLHLHKERPKEVMANKATFCVRIQKNQKNEFGSGT